MACHAVLAWLGTMALDFESTCSHGARGIELTPEEPAGSWTVLARCVRAFGYATKALFRDADPALEAQARADVEQAVVMARSVGLPEAWRALAEFMFACIETNLGDVDAAARWYQASFQTCEVATLEEGWLLPAALSGMAASLHLLGRSVDALASARRLLALQEHFSGRWPWFDGLAIEVTPALFVGGEREQADRELTKGAVAMRCNGVDLAPNHFLGTAAVVEFLRGQPERSARLFGAASTVAGADRAVTWFRTPTSFAFYRHYLPLVREALGVESARHARDEGRGMGLDEAFRYALQRPCG